MRAARLFTLLAMVGLAACGESTDVLGDLTEGEASELAAAVFMTVLASAEEAPDGPPPAAGPQAAPYTYTRDAEFAVECGLGGSVDVSASLDVEGDTQSEAGRIEYTMTQVHHGCRVASRNDVVFTLDGAPGLTVELVAENDGQGNAAFVGSLVGELAWETEGRGGRCEIALEFSGAINETAQTAEFGVAGSVCRASIQAGGSVG